jgi:DNA-binding transcriptional LysR family regulator
MFNWDDLKHFLAFARTGSIRAAAKAQRVDQSTVYRRLADLEARLGGPLIERHANGYRLTELGEELHPHAERVEEAFAALYRHMASRGQQLTGPIRLTCTPTVGERLKRTPLLDAFHALYPGLQIELVLTDRFVDLSKREADIAIREGRTIEDESLVGRKIAEGAWGLYASRSYVEHRGRPQRPPDITYHSVVHCAGPISDHKATRWLRAVAPDAKVAAHSESWPGLVLAVKSGAGLAPLSIALGDSQDDLVRVIDDIPELVTHFHVHKEMQRAPRVRAFFDFVVDEIKAFREALSGQTQQQNRTPCSTGTT